MAAKGRYVFLDTPDGRQRWRLAFKQMKGKYGLVDWGTKTIWLQLGQSPDELVDTVIHETNHVSTGFAGDETFEKHNERAAGNATKALSVLKLIAKEVE